MSTIAHRRHNRNRRQLSEGLNYDRRSTNPLASVHGSYGQNGNVTARGNGHDRPLNDMSAPYGIYSLALRAYSNGQMVISDRVK